MIKRENSKKKLLFSSGTIVVALVVFGFLIRAYVSQWQQKEKIKAEVAELGVKQEEFYKDNKKLEENLKFLGSQSYKAKVARSLNMKIEGEEVIIFPENFKVVEKNEPSTAPIDTGSNASKWWRYFFG